ncbi:hypothetical protein T492DRAFT_957322, partial [Pavlovales sp. CCMP2436]
MGMERMETLLSSASVPDLRAGLRSLRSPRGLRRIQSEANHPQPGENHLLRPPLLRFKSERLALLDENLDDGPSPPSPLRRALRRLAPLTITTELHELCSGDVPRAPETPGGRRALSIVFETRARDHRSRLTVTADVRLVGFLVCLVLISLTTVTAMSAATVAHVRTALGPGSSLSKSALLHTRRPALLPHAAEHEQHGVGSALLGQIESSHVGQSDGSSMPSTLASALAPTTPPLSLGRLAKSAPLGSARALAQFEQQRRAACDGARLALLALHALHSRLHLSTLLSPVHNARPARTVPATVGMGGAASTRRLPAPQRPPVSTPVAWAGGFGRARRLALGRHARQVALELEPLADLLCCGPLLGALSEASCAALLPDSYR